LLWGVVVSAIAFTVAPANGGVYVSACIRFNVKRKGFFPLLATGATVTGIHSFVWFKYVALVIHFFFKTVWHLAQVAQVAFYSCRLCRKCQVPFD
jgi:hypothetical protein